MDLKRLTPSLAVAPQVAPADMAALAAAGFTTVICNRPDGEQPGQPDHHTMAAAAQAAGLRFVFQPVVSGQIGPAQVQAFGEALAQATGPVLAYCRSGTRCTTLWALSQAGQRPWDELLATAAAAGYDLSRLPRPTP
ncbi:MAG: TIGR01244 family phosphatase [Hydrogenophaga sp.]|uniref:TIGR01244 family phosphatase n=1 Tax=Hydrogenophaga crocea TaxID=2716225 RepID=A0A6G8IDP8_9BURK|nr:MULTISPECIES: TIGR01244 family sulfur transferase [Hydrogenophaga]MBL0942983.1 TIGR01244 family phosphatase [Hydrogenophaga sp.]QIM51263.1 TIGR01244 family phosphatase [Hydrogenophaga crocea]